MTERPIRVGIFVIQFPKRSETFIVTKLLKMLDAGIDVHVFTLAESSDWDAFQVLAGREDVRARVHVLPPTRPLLRVLTLGAAHMIKTAAASPNDFSRYVAHNWRTRNETDLGFLKSIYQRSMFVGHELDILHIEFDMQGIGIADLKEFLDCRVLCSARGTFQHSSLVGKVDYLFRYVDGYHFISEFLDENTHRLGLPEDVPTWIIEPAIDLSLFDPGREPRAAGPLQLISVGRLDWMKGYEFALDAVAIARAAGVDLQYTIYGDGPYLEPIQFAIQQHGLQDCVRLAGVVRREEMPAAYARADIMVHAALHEGFCNAVIEAQAMRLPVVTSDAGGLPENVEHGVTGFVVPRRDARGMAARIAELANDPKLRERFGEAGRLRALARFDLERQAERFVRLYQELAKLPRRTAIR